jgi:hypothetical protein
MTITTNWLGDTDNWVIVAGEDGGVDRFTVQTDYSIDRLGGGDGSGTVNNGGGGIGGGSGGSPPPTDPVPAGTLIWSDEFSSSSLSGWIVHNNDHPGVGAGGDV